jgi:hypothetical protein
MSAPEREPLKAGASQARPKLIAVMADTEQHYVPHQIYARLPVLADMLNIVVELRSLIGSDLAIRKE